MKRGTKIRFTAEEFKYIRSLRISLSGSRVNRLVLMLTIIILGLCFCFIRPVFSHAAEVRDVVPLDVAGNTHLNITVWHDIESSLHYVDTIEVTYSSNTTSLTINPQPLEPDGTFTIDYNMGPILGTPTLTVRAHCTITGYTGSSSWTGQIPEFQLIVFLSVFLTATLAVIIFFKRTRGLK